MKVIIQNIVCLSISTCPLLAQQMVELFEHTKTKLSKLNENIVNWNKQKNILNKTGILQILFHDSESNYF